MKNRHKLYPCAYFLPGEDEEDETLFLFMAQMNASLLRSQVKSQQDVTGGENQIKCAHFVLEETVVAYSLPYTPGYAVRCEPRIHLITLYNDVAMQEVHNDVYII